MTAAAPAIPLELTRGTRFVAWRYEDRKGSKPAKVPYSPDATKGASSTNPAHWVTFEEATAYAAVAGLDGIGRVLVEGDGLVGIDFDNCRDPESGELAEPVAAMVKRLDTYTEISPSGQGVKLWAYGILPPHGRKRGDVELYSSGRFFTLTGSHLEGTPTIVGYRPDAIAAIHAEVFGHMPEPEVSSHGGVQPVAGRPDDEVIRLASESPHQGAKFRRLWAGDTSEYARGSNDGASEADCAQLDILAYYSGGDREQMERLFSQSALGAREKWQRADYRRRTIDFVLRGKTRFYGDDIGPPPPPPPPPTTPNEVAELRAALDTANAEITRLQRALLDRDDLLEDQQAVIRAERAEKDAAADVLRGITAVLALPAEHASPAFKVLTVVATLEMHSRASRGITTLPSVVLEERSGLSSNAVSAGMRDLAARDGSPIARKLTREWRTDEHGRQEPITVCETIPLHPTVPETLAALCAMGGPSPRELQRRAKDRERTETNRTWGQCSTHDNDLVAVKGHCPDCGEVVGERVVRREEFAALNPGIRETGPRAGNHVVVRTKDPGIRETGAVQLVEMLPGFRETVPDWLAEWPDLVPADVAIVAGVES